MAHYVAELIDSAENVDDPSLRSQARDKCCETIIRLWEHRASFPRGGRPLGNIEGVLGAINNIRSKKNPWTGPSSSHDVKRMSKDWMELAKSVEDAGLRICRIAILTAIAEASFEKEQCWLHEHSEMLSKEEKEIIEALEGWLSLEKLEHNGEDKVSILDMVPAERQKQITDEINKLVAKINTAVDIIQIKSY